MQLTKVPFLIKKVLIHYAWRVPVIGVTVKSIIEIVYHRHFLRQKGSAKSIQVENGFGSASRLIFVPLFKSNTFHSNRTVGY